MRKRTIYIIIILLGLWLIGTKSYAALTLKDFESGTIGSYYKLRYNGINNLQDKHTLKAAIWQQEMDDGAQQSAATNTSINYFKRDDYVVSGYDVYMSLFDVDLENIDKSKNVFFQNDKRYIKSYDSRTNSWQNVEISSNKKYTATYRIIYAQTTQINYKKELYAYYTRTISTSDKSDGSSTDGDEDGDGDADIDGDGIGDEVYYEEEPSDTTIRTTIGQVDGDSRKEAEYTDALTNTDKYTPKDDLSSNDVKKVEDTVGTIIAVITNIGIVLSIVVPAVLGTKYMISSSEEKAEMKEKLVPYFIGAVMLFGICTIVKIIQLLGQEINKI